LGSQYNFTTSTPINSNNFGMMILPMNHTVHYHFEFSCFYRFNINKGKLSTSSMWISIYASFSVISPKLSTSAKSNASASAIASIFSPSIPLRNPPYHLIILRHSIASGYGRQ
jgi:hypothetical protein